MDPTGLILCSRFAYPPNALSLCGPNKKIDLNWYATSGNIDQGEVEILTQFSTLYPYLRLIAQENKLNDPFDKRVVEAYWLGNDLLNNIKTKHLGNHLFDDLLLKKKLTRKQQSILQKKLCANILPCHAFHVLNIYKRTGNLNDLYTLQTMDACLINYGKVIKILSDSMIIKTQPLVLLQEKVVFGPVRQRSIIFQGKKDCMVNSVEAGDFVSCHWGYFCNKLTQRQLQNLMYYSNIALSMANETKA